MESGKGSLFFVMAKVFGSMLPFCFVSSGRRLPKPSSWRFLIGGMGALIGGAQAPWRENQQTFWER